MLQYDETLSNFAFKFKLRRYSVACASGAAEDAITKLVGMGADVSHVNGDGMSILMLAAEVGRCRLTR